MLIIIMIILILFILIKLFTVFNIILISFLYILFCVIIKKYNIIKYDKFVLTNYAMQKGNYFDYIIGATGSGKTTLSAYYLKKALKKGQKVYSFTPLMGAYVINSVDLGVYDLKNGLLIIDEAGIEFDNRKFKTNFSSEQIDFFKKHRHYNVDIVIISQSLDADKKLRDLSKRLFICKRYIIPFWFYTKEIKKFVFIDKISNEINDGYMFVPFSTRYFLSCKLWKFFDTHQPAQLKYKDWEKWKF